MDLREDECRSAKRYKYLDVQIVSLLKLERSFHLLKLRSFLRQKRVSSFEVLLPSHQIRFEFRDPLLS